VKNTSLRVRLVPSGLLSASLCILLFVDAERVLRPPAPTACIS